MYNIIPQASAFLSILSLSSSLLFPQYTDVVNWYPEQKEIQTFPSDSLVGLYGNALIQSASPYTPKVVASRWVTVTAYSSTIDQTDSTPFITASGSRVGENVVACNFLRFGTRVRFPQISESKIFVVEDRMAPKNSHKIDIWFETREQAKQFGIKQLKVEILGA